MVAKEIGGAFFVETDFGCRDRRRHPWRRTLLGSHKHFQMMSASEGTMVSRGASLHNDLVASNRGQPVCKF